MSASIYILRFSRLYPLYFVTFIFVAILQMMAYSTRGAFIIYPMNNLRHFFLSLFFASNWGLQLGFSFNAPTWSVSVEILLYAGFFLVALAVGKRIVVCLIMMGLGAWMSNHQVADIGWGLYGFFAGGLAFLLYERWGRGANGWPPVLFALGLMILSAMAIYGLSSSGMSPLQEALLFGGCFPSLVFLLAAVQNFSHGAGRSFKIIGDITYATYLLHFPVQLSVILITGYLGIALDYTNMVWLVLFMGAVILISLPTYYLFELPAQHYLRRYFIRRNNDSAS